MAVKFTKPEINVREKLAELDKPSGIAGEAMLRAETPQEQFNLIGAGRRNLIINGDMKVAQRGTSFTSHSGYTLDRYKGFGHTYNQIDNGDFYSLRMLWVTGTDANIYYPVELERGELENGQTYTLSFKYKSAGALMTLECFYRDSTAGSNVVSQIPVQTLPNSSEFTDYSITFTCSGRISAHGALNIRFGNSSGTKEIAKLQLEAGKIATSFETRSYGEELALCQRYYQAIPVKYESILGQAWNTTSARFPIQLPVEMRATPSITVPPPGQTGYAMKPLTASLSWPGGSGNNAVTATSSRSFYITCTGYSGLVSGNVSTLYAHDISYIKCEAEL